MFMTRLLISGLRKQHILLEELLDHLESKSKLDRDDHDLYGEMTGQVAKNLKKLGRIKRQYVTYLDSEKDSEPSQVLLESWMIRSGVSPKSNLAANQIGLYTDFT